MRALFALFIRSVREDLRARLPPILRATLVLVLLLILWANERDFTRTTAPGREFLGMVLFANLGLIAIATLGIFPSAITEEKEDQTLTLLRMTKLSPLAILFGKGTSRMLSALLLLVAQIPFTVLAVTLGGVSLDQVFQGYAILGATLFFLCNLALLCSVVCRTTLMAGTWTGIVAAVLFVILPYVIVVTVFRTTSPTTFVPQNALQSLAISVLASNPVYVLAVLLFGIKSGPDVAKHVWINLGAGAQCFLLAWLAFDRFCATAGERIAQHRPKGGIFRSRNRPACGSSVAWKEFHFTVGGFRGLLIRCGICALIFGGAYAYSRWVDHYWNTTDYVLRRTGRHVLELACAFFALDTGLLASRIFGDERRHLTLGTLVALPKTTGWIIRQKLRGCSAAILPSAALFGVGCWLQIRWGDSRWLVRWVVRHDGWIVLSYIASQALLLPVLIAWLSLKLRRGAMPAGIALMIAMNALVAVFAGTMLRGRDKDRFIGFAAVCLLIMAVALVIRIHRTLPRVAAAE
jgi:hypothetical protein